MAPTTPTLENFPRLDPVTSDRSPSRSPRRKAQFAFRELDPLLGNLSPDSTLRALQATETISTGAAQEDALTSSIADATPAERELGIRAAFAAQKLREWKEEVARWKWPGKQERGSGLGFIPPPDAQHNDIEYRGCLPASLVEEYEVRLEEIRDDLDSLGINEIKDHVLEAHRPSSSSAKSRPAGARASYGRMRDFTALITATVIQALPDLAKLNKSLDTWDIRLRVLRELPRFLEVMQSTQSGTQHAFNQIRDPTSARNLTEAVLDSRKMDLGGQVSDMGRRIDRLLDMLEGQDDTLPQAWIDRLENIELDYATWVVEAQHVLLKNQLAPNSTQGHEPMKVAKSLAHIEDDRGSIAPVSPLQPDSTQIRSPEDTAEKGHISELPTTDTEELKVKRKPSLKLDLAQPRSHRREVSKVSVAESMYSTFSDISNAEIMDAKSTSVLPSPKVSVVDNPFRASRDEITWFGSAPAAQQQLAAKPPMLQRASTASIEVFPKEKLKEVVLQRSASWDMLSQRTHAPEETRSKTLARLTGVEVPNKSDQRMEDSALLPSAPSMETTPLATPSLQIEPLHVPSRQETQPQLPRRSSKRNTLSGLSPITPTTSATTEDLVQHSSPPSSTKHPSRRHKKSESLDEKIQGILTTLPTKIRLAKDVDSESSSSSTTRSSTPTPALTLSPARADPSSRKGNLADPDIKLYHLTRTGQGREAPPIKLFVRTVGDGDRVMVRVGGGWADLGEYLKEYSLHHGSRATIDGRLEVASFPGNGQVTAANVASASQGRQKSRSPTAVQTTFKGTDLVNPKTRSSMQRPGSLEDRTIKGDGIAPPVPPIPSSYTVRSATTTSATRREAGATTNVFHADVGDPETPSQRRHSVVSSQGGVTTTTVVTPPVITTNYTPLGGAGPKMNARRVPSTGASPNNNDAWVQGMVGKARAVSGTSPTIIQGPNGTSTTITTTTTVSSTPPSSGRRASSYFSVSPNNPNSSPITISTSPSTGSVASDAKSGRRVSYTSGSRKSSRMSLGDIGGIKRVFLRKKSDAFAK
ncbi:hypothetical protein G647_04756 [Cladophialophora carrionii CBS 160.54]|uniref:GAR domain-containing protein n=1 Tax=Cladophialophora carrionii CBS 160.54 TaxID=1279043 RepID=V9D8I3_9EURO|nr:uncharacterized protein G647_04756 [Cladophialophora carrionii CBS 160.54]ETI22961.1 hypothetical protein G647_04756 [Cladophialophora carrionii CBS 160.54]